MREEVDWQWEGMHARGEAETPRDTAAVESMLDLDRLPVGGAANS